MILSEIRAQGWKYGAYVLFLALAASVIYGLWQRGTAAKAVNAKARIEADYKTDKDAWTIRESEYKSAIEGYKQQQADFARIVRDETAKLEAAKAESAQAVSEANAAKAKADASLQGWMKEYSKRPASCQAALEAVEATCAAQSSY